MSLGLFLLIYTRNCVIKHISIKEPIMDLQKTLSENSVVLVDFYATWCQPCRMMSPIIDAISTEYTGRVEVVKVDVDQYPNLANEFDVTSVPTFLLF
jgi:thioredoxin 1